MSALILDTVYNTYTTIFLAFCVLIMMDCLVSHLTAEWGGEGQNRSTWRSTCVGPVLESIKVNGLTFSCRSFPKRYIKDELPCLHAVMAIKIFRRGLI